MYTAEFCRILAGIRLKKIEYSNYRNVDEMWAKRQQKKGCLPFGSDFVCSVR